MRPIPLSLMLTTSLAACNLPSEAKYEIQIVGVTVGPGQSSGEAWDGTGTVPEEAWSLLRQALGSVNPALALASYLAEPVVQNLSKPDPLGTAQLRHRSFQTDTVQLGTRDTNEEDNFEVTWQQGTGWAGITWDDDMRISIDLKDEDDLTFDTDDSIAQIEINAEDICTALKKKQVHQVLVADQAPNPMRPQLLMVSITVRQDSGDDSSNDAGPCK